MALWFLPWSAVGGFVNRTGPGDIDARATFDRSIVQYDADGAYEPRRRIRKFDCNLTGSLAGGQP